MASAAERIVANKRAWEVFARMGDGARHAYETEFNRTIGLGQFERLFGPVVRPDAA